MTEHEIQTTFFDILRLNEAKYPELKWIYAVPNGGKRHVTTAVRMKREGVKAGIWDVHIPITSEAPGAWIEFKADKNKLTASQSAFEDHLLFNGYERAVCYTVDEALLFVERYLGITLAK